MFYKNKPASCLCSGRFWFCQWLVNPSVEYTEGALCWWLRIQDLYQYFTFYLFLISSGKIVRKNKFICVSFDWPTCFYQQHQQQQSLYTASSWSSDPSRCLYTPFRNFSLSTMLIFDTWIKTKSHLYVQVTAYVRRRFKPSMSPDVQVGYLLLQCLLKWLMLDIYRCQLI